jgi:hypothetical protein
MRRMGVAAVLLVVAVVACGGDSECDSPLAGARTYYESLDLGSPVAAARTYADAFARDDFMTVWLVLDSQAQFRITQLSNLMEYDQLLQSDRVDDIQARLGEAFNFETMEMSDSWYVFDQFMLIADRNDAFLIDLSGSTSLGEARTVVGGAEVPAEVEGIDGEVTFRLVLSPSGRWRVHQVVVPGGDQERIPWSVPTTE